MCVGGGVCECVRVCMCVCVDVCVGREAVSVYKIWGGYD